MKLFSQHNHKGFTLIETLFAVLIFSAALISLMTIAGRGIAAANTAREQTVAHYLAQEGVEVVRNTRDAAFLNGGWSAGFDTCTESSPCQILYNNGGTTAPQLDSCISGLPEGCPINESLGAYVDNGTPSPYFRKIYATPMGTQDTLTGGYSEYLIVSTISWKSKEINRSVSMQTILKKWQ